MNRNFKYETYMWGIYNKKIIQGTKKCIKVCSGFNLPEARIVKTDQQFRNQWQTRQRLRGENVGMKYESKGSDVCK